MPTIEVYKDTLLSFIGKEMGLRELEDLLPAAKAELDGYEEAEGIVTAQDEEEVIDLGDIVV